MECPSSESRTIDLTPTTENASPSQISSGAPALEEFEDHRRRAHLVGQLGAVQAADQLARDRLGGGLTVLVWDGYCQLVQHFPRTGEMSAFDDETAPLDASLRHHLLIERGGSNALLELRRGVEIESARLAAGQGAGPLTRRMRELLASMASSFGDPAAYLAADVALHDTIAEGSGNTLIRELLTAVREATHDATLADLRDRLDLGELAAVHRAHRRLVDALEAGDPDGAAAAMSDHFEAVAAAAERWHRIRRDPSGEDDAQGGPQPGGNRPGGDPPGRDQPARAWSYPATPRSAVSDDYHGTLVRDPYRWCEDEDLEITRAWSAAQRELTEAYLVALPERQGFRERLAELWDHARHGLPERHGRYLFYQHNDGLANQPVLYRRLLEASEEPEVAVDPNGLSDDGTAALAAYGISRDGRYVAYGVSRSGSDWQVIHVRDLKTATDLPDELDHCRFTVPVWSSDGAGFYYSRYPSAQEAPEASPGTHQRVYYHLLGTSQAEDSLVYARPDAPGLGFHAHLSDDGRYLVLYVWDGTERRNRLYYRELSRAAGAATDGGPHATYGGPDATDGTAGADARDEFGFVRLLDEQDASYEFVDNDGTVLYLLTDLDAPNGRVIALDVRRPERRDWREVIPERAEPIDDVQAADGRLVVQYLHHASHRLEVFGTDGASTGEVPLPALSSVTGMSGRRDEPDLYVSYESFLSPASVVRVEPSTRETLTLHEGRAGFDAERFETRRVFVKTSDGTRLPLFVTSARGIELDGSHPTLLYGYGGFGVNVTPTFEPTRVAWLERGGVYAQAALRGGGEYGEAWHAAGKLDRKQTVFDDFIAVARWLVASGFTSPERLAIEGRSNGGLLVAACLTQRPELFGAVHCAVPVVDMLRFERFTAGRYWVPEYGRASDGPEALATLLTYSPLHNVRQGASYPATLITTGESDDRVVPMHARKFAAALQEADGGENPLLLRVDTKAGHGALTPTSKRIATGADVLAFLWAALTRGPP